MQVEFLSCVSTLLRLLKSRTIMTFLDCGAVAISLSSFSLTPLPIPSDITFVGESPDSTCFNNDACAYIYGAQDKHLHRLNKLTNVVIIHKMSNHLGFNIFSDLLQKHLDLHNTRILYKTLTHSWALKT